MKWILAMLLTSAMLLGATTCSSFSAASGASSAAAASKSNRGKTDLVITTATEAVTLGPQDDWDGNSLYIMRQPYNDLVKLNDKMEIVDDLAESWGFTSNTSVTFKLKHNVRFHNDDEVKASNVVYGIERTQGSVEIKTFTIDIASVAADDGYTVTIKTNIPYAPLMSDLYHTANSIVSQKATEAADDKLSVSSVDIGPFKFVKWDFDGKVVLEKNADCFAGTVKPTPPTFRLMSKGPARIVVLETGEAGLSLIVTTSSARRISEKGSMKLVTSMGPKIEYVSMNRKRKPFDNALVRRAINYAVDRKSLNAVATVGYGEVTDSVMSEQISGYTDGVAHYDYNPEKAKELLEQAGYENGFETTILVSSDTRNTEAQLIWANLAKIGVNVTINTVESTVILGQINNGGYKMPIMNYNNTTGGPDTSLYMLSDSKVPASSGNRLFTNIPEVDWKLEAARAEIDADARTKIYAELQKTLIEQAVWVPLYCVSNPVGIRGDLSSYTPHPLGNDMFDQPPYK